MPAAAVADPTPPAPGPGPPALAPVPVDLPGGAPAGTPAQQDVLRLLGSRAAERPTFPAGLRDGLRAGLEERLAPVAAALAPGETLRLSRHVLNRVLGCEERFLAMRDRPFEWTPAAARGAVVHKAVELSVHWSGGSHPLDLVDEAIARLGRAGDSLAGYLRGGTGADRAELRAGANAAVAAFVESFPSLRRAWRPVTSSAVRAEAAGGRILLRGQVDLTLGHARGRTARKVLVDLKAGPPAPGHADDLRFYALVETLRLGTPPIRLATFYLDAARAETEDVTVDSLHAALDRTVEAATGVVELVGGRRPPRRRPGAGCRWCPCLAACPERAGPDDGGGEPLAG